jgi:hypothetical protein
MITERCFFIGGSDARIIMGNDEARLIRLWREKRGEVEPEDDLSHDLIVQRGTITEDLNRNLIFLSKHIYPAIKATLAYRHLFRAFAPLREPHARSTTILRNELHAGLFKRPHNSLDGATLCTELAGLGLEPLNTRQRHPGRLC